MCEEIPINIWIVLDVSFFWTISCSISVSVVTIRLAAVLHEVWSRLGSLPCRAVISYPGRLGHASVTSSTSCSSDSIQPTLIWLHTEIQICVFFVTIPSVQTQKRFHIWVITRKLGQVLVFAVPCWTDLFFQHLKTKWSDCMKCFSWKWCVKLFYAPQKFLL